MEHQPSALLEVLGSRFNKKNFFTHLNNNLSSFEEAIQIGFGDTHPQAWRACWAIHHLASKNDKRIVPHISTFITVLPKKGDGHQREILKLLLKMNIPEDLEGILFDKSVSIWEDISKSPSVRMIAFKVLVKIAAHYPEMKNEISFLIQDQYLDSLSPGIKNSMLREVAKLNKPSKLLK